MVAPFATASRRTPIYQVSLVTPPAHRCPRQRQRRQRQRVTEGTAMAPSNGPNKVLTPTMQGKLPTDDPRLSSFNFGLNGVALQFPPGVEKKL